MAFRQPRPPRCAGRFTSPPVHSAVRRTGPGTPGPGASGQGSRGSRRGPHARRPDCTTGTGSTARTADAGSVSLLPLWSPMARAVGCSPFGFPVAPRLSLDPVPSPFRAVLCFPARFSGAGTPRAMRALSRGGAPADAPPPVRRVPGDGRVPAARPLGGPSPPPRRSCLSPGSCQPTLEPALFLNQLPQRARGPLRLDAPPLLQLRDPGQPRLDPSGRRGCRAFRL